MSSNYVIAVTFLKQENVSLENSLHSSKKQSKSPLASRSPSQENLLRPSATTTITPAATTTEEISLRDMEKVKSRNLLLYMVYKIQNYFIKKYLSKQNYIHCEIAFLHEKDASYKSGKCKAFGVTIGGVFKKERTFSNPNYEWIFLKFSKKEYESMLNFCESQVGKAYDHNGTKWLVVWPRECPHDKWWCVPLVVTALKKGGIFAYYDPWVLDVDDVFTYLNTHSRKTQEVSPLSVKSIFNNELDVDEIVTSTSSQFISSYNNNNNNSSYHFSRGSVNNV